MLVERFKRFRLWARDGGFGRTFLFFFTIIFGGVAALLGGTVGLIALSVILWKVLGWLSVPIIIVGLFSLVISLVVGKDF